MKKQLLTGLALGLLLFGTFGLAQASLTTIGTATYEGSDYKLIWDDDNNGNSVVWLDYTAGLSFFDTQKLWATSLDTALVLNLDPGYSVTWDSSWRLPATADGGPYIRSNDGTTAFGYNITDSEMGHLYYEELGNLGYYDTLGNYPQTGWGLDNVGDFQNLTENWYWSGSETPSNTNNGYIFNMSSGDQSFTNKAKVIYGIAVRSGQVSAVPVPGCIWLLGSGITGLFAVRHRKKKM